MRINLNNLAGALGCLISLSCAGAPSTASPSGSASESDVEQPGAFPPEGPESAASQGSPSLPARVERRLALMGTWLSLEVSAGSREASLAASEAALLALEAAEARLSTWRDASELSRLNRIEPGVRFELSAELAAELLSAQELWRATAGAFDPGVGALLRAWDVRHGGRIPSALELSQARADAGFAGLLIEGRQALRLHPGLVIEEGGFGKGAGLDRALQALAEAGAHSAILDLGGQVLLYGSQSATLGLADPKDRERALLKLSIDSGSLATSGNSERGFVLEGEAYSHIIDPRSGRPAMDFGSLSVWAPDATQADALSTGLYVMGPERAIAWALAHQHIEIIVLMKGEDGYVALATPGWQGRLEALDPKLEIRFVTSKSQLHINEEK